LPGELGTGDGGITATPAAVRGGIAFRSLASGAHHVCGLDFGGVAYCWGLNLAGQLGAAGGENCAGPATSNKDFVWSCVKAPTRVSGQLTFGSLTAGWQHTCGLTPAGRAYCWGDYLFAGTIGSVPRPVGADLVFTSLSSGSASSHTCGVTAANVAYCWGRNDKGQLGDGSTNSRLTPVRVDGGHAFAAVTAGDEHTCGITVAGVVYCWGNNVLGQLGVGIASAGSVRPVKVSGQ
jgi:alpha-tubulin suppressor-like RCC1 family protein